MVGSSGSITAFHAREKNEMKLSISQIAELTGVHRDIISKRLADLPFEPGKKGAHLYESTEALPLIYAIDNLEAARAQQALSQTALNRVREEDLRKRLIPVQMVHDINVEIRDEMMRILRAAKGKKLTPDRINELFAKFRAIPKKWKRGQSDK
jgi:hypothetical protein